MTPTQMKLFKEAIGNISDFRGEPLTPNSYSGRFMYGKTCFSISGNEDECASWVSGVITSLIDIVFNEAMDCDDNEDCLRKSHQFKNDAKEIVETLIKEQKRDNMGRNIVLYWPDIPWGHWESFQDENEVAEEIPEESDE
jgi:hypothetical protein